METLENNILAVVTEKGMTKKALCRETGINKGSLVQRQLKSSFNDN